MLKHESSLSSSADMNSQLQDSSSMKVDEISDHFPFKKYKADLEPPSLYSKLFRKRLEKPFIPPNPDSIPDISLVVFPGDNACQNVRKPFISIENSPVGLGFSEYKHLLDMASSGLVSFDSQTLVANPRKPGCALILNQVRPYESKSVVLTSNHSSVTTATTDTTSTVTSPAASEWCSWVSSTPYLSSGWLSNLTTAVATSLSQWERRRGELEEEIGFWEQQRKLSEETKVNDLELRLSCLLQTPPVLHDPYLKPQPIPQELPYKRPVKLPSLPVLTGAEIAMINQRLSSATDETVLVNSYRLGITRRELVTLTGTNWLNDMVINFYFQLIAHRSRQLVAAAAVAKDALRVATMNSFFYAKLTSGSGYAGVRRWTRSTNLFEHDLILVPIHDRTIHWCLVAINLREKTLSYYDSMGGTNERCLNALLNYLDSESQDKLEKPLEAMSQWKKINTGATVPQQGNGSDCGVFVCTYAEFLSRGAEFTFSQKDMPGIRLRMIYEILTRQLLTTGTKLAEA